MNDRILSDIEDFKGEQETYMPETEESKDYNLRLEAGLTPTGINDDGEEEWIGESNDWKRYEKLKEQHA